MKIKKQDVIKLFDSDLTISSIIYIILIIIGVFVLLSSIISLSLKYLNWDFTEAGESLRGLSIGLFLLSISLFKLEK